MLIALVIFSLRFSIRERVRGNRQKLIVQRPRRTCRTRRLLTPSSRLPSTAAPPGSRASSSAAARSVSRDPSQRERPVSEASTVFVDTPTATTFHVPPPPGPTLKPTEASVTPVTIVHHHQQQREEPDHVTSPSQDDFADVQQAEEELLLAARRRSGKRE